MKEVEEGRRKEAGRVGGRKKRQGMGGAQAQRKKMEGQRKVMYIYILHT